jgi:hypothetical protein
MVGSIRTVSKRYTGTQPEPGEIVIHIDRTNKVLGNQHEMACRSLAERDRVIAANQVDIETDWARGGPISRALEQITARVLAGERVALACWCAPVACHGDNYVRVVRMRVAQLLDRREQDEARPEMATPGM